MTPAELITTNTRRWLNDETVATYKWTQAELIDYYNWCMDDLARETDYFRDAYTTAMRDVALVAGTSDYALDSRTLQILSARIAGETNFVTKTDLFALNSEIPTWRYKKLFSGTDISFADAGPDTIVSTTTDFSDINDDDFIEVSGATNVGNNSTFQVDTAAKLLLTLTSAASLTAEAAANRIIIRQINAGTPEKYILDYREGYITLYPTPDAAGSMLLHTVRKQLAALTVATLGSVTIPIKEEYHYGLIDGILSKAFLKAGPQTFNIEKATVHAGLFTNLLNKIKTDRIKMEAKASYHKAHKGAI
jgi:hypothetical protein